MFKLGKVFVALGLACSVYTGAFAHGRMGADGYSFDKKEWKMLDFQVSVKVYSIDSYFEFDAMEVVDREGKIKAFSKVNLGKKTCNIFIMDPAIEYKPELIGHEIIHCMYGNFHNKAVSNLVKPNQN